MIHHLNHLPKESFSGDILEEIASVACETGRARVVSYLMKTMFDFGYSLFKYIASSSLI